MLEHDGMMRAKTVRLNTCKTEQEGIKGMKISHLST